MSIDISKLTKALKDFEQNMDTLLHSLQSYYEETEMGSKFYM